MRIHQTPYNLHLLYLMAKFYFIVTTLTDNEKINETGCKLYDVSC